jgi:pseudo-rSAM protein
LENLSEISIHVDAATNIKNLIPYLKSISQIAVFNIIGNLENVPNYKELLLFLEQQSASTNIVCSYTKVALLQVAFTNSFAYSISVQFPIDIQKWENTIQIFGNQSRTVEYIFEVTSDANCLQAKRLIDRFQLEKYQIKPAYTKANINFFEVNVFLNKEDILSASLSIKDFFIRQSINLYDFGKINIMPNGDVYANVNHPLLGNIYKHSIYEIVRNEFDKGVSWFRVRNQAPCNDCVYQWLCPSPSDYEIAIGRPNLCHVKR